MKNNAESIRTLLDLGASPNYKDAKGLTPLYLTVSQSADVTLTEMLLHDHAIVGAQDLQGWQEVHQVSKNNEHSFCISYWKDKYEKLKYQKNNITYVKNYFRHVETV